MVNLVNLKIKALLVRVVEAVVVVRIVTMAMALVVIKRILKKT